MPLLPRPGLRRFAVLVWEPRESGLTSTRGQNNRGGSGWNCPISRSQSGRIPVDDSEWRQCWCVGALESRESFQMGCAPCTLGIRRS